MPSPTDDLTGFGTTAESSLATVPPSVMQPVSNYLGDVVTGRAALQSLQSLNTGPRYDPSKSVEQNVMAGLPTATNVAMGTGPGIIGGMRGAATAEKTNLGQITPTLGGIEEAVRLEESGVHSPEDIFSMTGWYRGPDKQWKFVLSDKDAALMHGEEGFALKPNVFMPDILTFNTQHNLEEGNTLKDVLYHPDLYKTYPWAKDTRVVRLSPADQIAGYQGTYSPMTDTLSLGTGTHDEMLQTVLHEIQHAIQYKEGFGRGGMVNEFLPPEHGPLLDKAEKSWEDLRLKMEAEGHDPALISGIFREHFRGNEPSKFQKGAFALLSPELQKEASQTLPGLMKLRGERADAYERYRNLSGEVESRAVEQMWRQKLWDRMPSQLVGATPVGKQEVRFGGSGGSSLSLDKQDEKKVVPGLVERGNVNLAVRPVVTNPDGSRSTVRSMSFREGGQEILIPTVAADGKRILSDQEAIAQYRKTGQFLGKFDSIRSANDYAKRLHEDQAQHPPSPASPR